MLRERSVKVRIFATLAVPVLVLCLVTGFLSFQAFQSASAAKQTHSVVDLLDENQQLVTAMQLERTNAVQVMSGNEGARGMQADYRADTDAKLSAFNGQLAELELDQLAARIDQYRTFTTVQTPIDLAILRDQVDRKLNNSADISKKYSEAINDVLELPTILFETLEGREIAATLGLYAVASETIDYILVEYPLVGAAYAEAATGAESNRILQELARFIGVTDATRARLNNMLDRTENTEIQLAAEGPAYNSMRRELALGSVSGVHESVAGKWAENVQNEIGKVVEVRDALDAQAKSLASDDVEELTQQAWLTILVTSVLVLLCVLIASWIASRSIGESSESSDKKKEVGKQPDLSRPM